MRLAQSLATAVLYIHSCGYVHKNIRPENLIVFEPENAGKMDKFPYAIGEVYLVGYDGLRKEENHSELNDAKMWKHKIYLPSERLCAKSDRVKFTWRHDIYSLGVTLQEIALWENFASDDGRIRKLFSQAANPAKGLEEVLQLRKKQVPSVLGDRYNTAVTACLLMLRTEGETATIEERETARDEDGIALGTTYVSKVLDNLEVINV